MSHFELSLGATYLGEGRSRFRVWAPDRKSVEVAIEERGGRLNRAKLERDERGYFWGHASAWAGTRYRYCLDGRDCFPDPCSRFQPEGPHGPSEVVDPHRFTWTDRDWPGLSLRGNVFYELHVGAFSPSGNYRGVAAQLPRLKSLGVTAIELMPVNTFPGRFNWGYDGVDLFAPCAVYGSPDELRGSVDESHRVGLGVILDVVYNHLGPDGNYLWQYAQAYFSKTHRGEWGDPLNLDAPGAEGVRDFVVQNACYWLAEFHFDGLRLDATQGIYDCSDRHVLSELSPKARQAAAPRRVLLIAESEPQDVTLLEPLELGGCGLDLMWIDDFHHASRVAATGRAEAYLSDFRGTPSELVACARDNSIFQGQWSTWQKKPRGTPLLTIEPDRLVFYLQSHDQVSNSLGATRLVDWAGPAVARAWTAYWLLLPHTPMLFMGQESSVSTPFFYFTDHRGELAERVAQGREGFLRQWASIRLGLEEQGQRIPRGEEAFRVSRLDPPDGKRAEAAELFHRELLRLRREDEVFNGARRACLESACLGASAVLVRAFGREGFGDRLVILNWGPELPWVPCSEPLLAPPRAQAWRALFSSEESRFGGRGAAYPAGVGPWQLAGPATIVLSSEREP